MHGAIVWLATGAQSTSSQLLQHFYIFIQHGNSNKWFLAGVSVLFKASGRSCVGKYGQDC